jgi:putative alpha-1,2-mannosidase
MSLFRRKKQEAVVDFTATLTIEGEKEIAIESALLTSLKLIQFQREAWNDLVEAVTGVGISVNPSAEAQQEYKELLMQLQAAMVVLAENTNYPTDIISQIGNDTL